MVSTQTICVCSPLRLQLPGVAISNSAVSLQSPPVRRPGGLQCSSVCSALRLQQPGGGTNSAASLQSPLRRPGGLQGLSGQAFRTMAIKQGSSSSFSTGEDASHHKVPAKDAAAHHTHGTNTMELEDPLKLQATVFDDQLPPLLSIIIDGLPSFQISKHVDEAKKRLRQYTKRFPNVTSLNSYFDVGLSTTAYVHAGVISVDRLVAMSINYGLLFLLDDLLMDSPNESSQDQYGISRSVCGSPKKIQEYLDYLDAVFGQQIQPSNQAPLIETLMWESGRDMLALSNPEWFNHYVECIKICHKSSVDSEADIVKGNKLWSQDLESYTMMRDGNAGGAFIQMLLEFSRDAYIPNILKTTPYFENVTTATSIHLGFVNDVFSYPREILEEQNPRNLITVLTNIEGKPFVETVHRAIDLIHTYTHRILDLESQASNSTLQNHLQDIKTLIAGNVYFCLLDKRYHHPNSVFPELRNATDSWKIHFHV